MRYICFTESARAFPWKPFFWFLFWKYRVFQMSQIFWAKKKTDSSRYHIVLSVLQSRSTKTFFKIGALQKFERFNCKISNNSMVYCDRIIFIKQILEKWWLVIYYISFLTLRARTVFKNFLKKWRQFRCTGLLRSSKLVHLHRKNLASFTRNLVQNLMKLVLFSESTGKGWKMAKTKVVQKNANRRLSETKG